MVHPINTDFNPQIVHKLICPAASYYPYLNAFPDDIEVAFDKSLDDFAVSGFPGRQSARGGGGHLVIEEVEGLLYASALTRMSRRVHRRRNP